MERLRAEVAVPQELGKGRPPSSKRGACRVSAVARTTLVIPAHNAARTIGSCLAAVSAMDARPGRVVVLDDRSADSTAALARSAGAEVVAVPADGGLGRARNLGILLAADGLLAFLNADCRPRPSWLGLLLTAMEQTGAAVVGGRQVELRHGTWAERWKALHLRQDLGDQPITDPDFLSGGNLVVDPAKLSGVRFDTRFCEAYEDVAFCRALRAAGRHLLYEPAAVVGHDHNETLRTLPRKVWSYGIHSRSVGPVTSIRDVPGAFLRMHTRPHDQVRRALSHDLRCARSWSFLIDMYLLAASLGLFIQHVRQQKPKAPRRATPRSCDETKPTQGHDLPYHHGVQQQVPQLRNLATPIASEGARDG